MFHQILAPVGGSLTLSALVAVLPLVTLFVLLGAFKTPARWAALAGLIVSLIVLGFNPLKAAAVCLVANTSPVAFGALGLPVTTLAKLTKLPVHDLATMIGRQTPLLALFIPFILLGIVDGRRGLRETWPVAAAAAISFSITQSLASYLFPVELVDICSALVSTAVTVGFLRIFRRVGVSVPAPQPAVAG